MNIKSIHFQIQETSTIIDLSNTQFKLNAHTKIKAGIQHSTRKLSVTSPTVSLSVC